MDTKIMPEQEVLVEAMASALPGYDFTAEQWFEIMMRLRIIARAANDPSYVRLFFEDIARAADAMYNRLSGSKIYSGKEELDKVLGEVKNI